MKSWKSKKIRKEWFLYQVSYIHTKKSQLTFFINENDKNSALPVVQNLTISNGEDTAASTDGRHY